MKTCQKCGKEFFRRIGPKGIKEAIVDYNARKYCSHQCFLLAKPAKKPNLLINPHSCLQCGEKLVRKRYKVIEPKESFLTRRFCSSRCRLKYGRNNCSGIAIATQYKKSQKHRKLYCEICGDGGKLHCHHIDGNVYNNSAENLLTLCVKHHVDIHRKNKP